MNKVFLIGNLTRDPELRTTPSGKSVCTFTIAANRKKKNKSQNEQPEADFFRITVWNGLGESCAKYLTKGRKVSVVGPVSCRTYEGNDGVTRASLEVEADDVEFLTPRDKQETGGASPKYQRDEDEFPL
ncbi:MAG: single-stranded DNA-binding protein [Clostridia bacterium]|nr:single-stranded DNA-binding protein [Clostridia bacterium]